MIAGREQATTFSAPAARTVAEAVAQARAGDRDAFEELYSRFCPAVTRRVSFLVGARGPVPDLVQETFVLAYRGLARFRDDAAFGQWVLRIAVNVARTQQRQERRSLFRLWDRAEDADGVASSVRSVEAAYPDLQAVQKAMEHLSITLREAVILYELEELSLPEMASLLGISVNTAASRVRRGRERLRRVLESMGYSPCERAATALCGEESA